MTIAYLGLGSNLGKRKEQIEEALRRLGRVPGVRLLARSGLVETDPVGGRLQGRFLNGAAAIETELGPEALLGELQRIESELGRARAERNEPRTIDLDLLLYGDSIVSTPDLSIPHPRVAERDFVLGPLCEIAPEVVHPLLGKNVADLYQDVLERGGA